MCLPSDASRNTCHLTWVSLTLDEGYLLTASPPDLEHGVAPLGPPIPVKPPLLGCMKRQNDKILKEELPRSVGAQYATGDQWRNNSRKNEGLEPKQKQNPVVNGTVIEERFDAVKSNIA